MRLRLVLAVLIVGAATGVVVGVPSAPGQTELDAARAEVQDATDQLEDLLARLEAAQGRGNELAAEYWQVESGLQLIHTQLAQAEAEYDEIAESRASLLVQARDIALDQYVAGVGAGGVTWSDWETTSDREVIMTLAELVVGSDQATLDQLAVVQDEFERQQVALEDQRAEQADTLAGVEATQASIEDELRELELVRGALQGELTRLEGALDRLETAELERLAAEERARVAEELRRAEEAAARAAALAAVATPVPTATPLPAPTTAPTAAPTPTTAPTTVPTAAPAPTAEATAIPNPQPSEPFPTPTPIAPPATATPEPTSVAEPTPTPVPNPQPPASGGSGGGIVCPLAGPFTHTDDFNAPRAVGGVHRANDLISPTGTPVLAVASGTVEHRNSSVGGMSAHLRGDNGDYYFYTHLSGYENVGAGHVTAGTVIGYVGMTGNAPIPHLHFEIHRGGYGNYSNPFGPVRAACGT